MFRVRGRICIVFLFVFLLVLLLVLPLLLPSWISTNIWDHWKFDVHTVGVSTLAISSYVEIVCFTRDMSYTLNLLLVFLEGYFQTSLCYFGSSCLMDVLCYVPTEGKKNNQGRYRWWIYLTYSQANHHRKRAAISKTNSKCHISYTLCLVTCRWQLIRVLRGIYHFQINITYHFKNY